MIGSWDDRKVYFPLDAHPLEGLTPELPQILQSCITRGTDKYRMNTAFYKRFEQRPKIRTFGEAIGPWKDSPPNFKQHHRGELFVVRLTRKEPAPTLPVADRKIENIMTVLP